MVLSASSFAHGCSPPSGYEERTGLHYKVFSSAVSFASAKAACQADGAHLAYFRTGTEESNMWHFSGGAYYTGPKKYICQLLSYCMSVSPPPAVLAADAWIGLENPDSNVCTSRDACLGQVEFGDGTDLASFSGIYTKVVFWSGQNCAIAKNNVRERVHLCATVPNAALLSKKSF